MRQNTVASNEYGQASRSYRLKKADAPKFPAGRDQAKRVRLKLLNVLRMVVGRYGPALISTDTEARNEQACQNVDHRKCVHECRCINSVASAAHRN